METAYTPFDCPIENLTASSLGALWNVLEGWHTEYKSAFEPVLAKHAKFISGFANAHGGWLFYGIEQKRATGETDPSCFPGVPTRDVPSILRAIAEANAQHASPSCYYQVKVVDGPEDSLSLRDDRSVICLYVPASPNPPHVTRDGVIYRRVFDEFQPLKDRAVIDRMFEERHAHLRSLQQRITEQAKHDNSIGDTAVIHLFIDRSPHSQAASDLGLTFEEFGEICTTRDSECEPTGLTFDNIYRAPGGYVARVTQDNSFHLPAVTWRHFFDGSSVVSVSHSTCVLRDTHRLRGDIADFLAKKHIGKAFADELERAIKKASGPIRVVDIDAVWPTAMAIVYKHWRLTKRAASDSYFVRLRLDNCRYAIPFLDAQPYLEFVQKWKPPFLLDESYLVPKSASDPPFVIRRPPPDLEVSEWFHASGGYPLLAGVCVGLGLPLAEHDAIQTAVAHAAQRLFGLEP